MLLEHVKNVNVIDEELEAEYAALEEGFNSIVAQFNEDFGMVDNSDMRMPAPGQADRGAGEGEFDQPEDLVSAMEVIVKQMAAAKRGMAIINKMSDSSSRTKNRSRVMGNLNRIRGSLDRIFKKMQAMSDSGDYEDSPAH